ncbi:coiled-coil domain-containing protein 160 homolog [Asterias rubens]|uniref:coiled-coil domain-containing protein 160 homolog n=1 Tax=Asterias rubens TaxID=7604 RepID=UPI00145565B6|nr:coiled-coil domain-containing protein 160 homolog [Asterias rubens]XP_033637407.1 coiled-coil domain-containing protein 160 homolog [Asterias rubens]
MEKHWVEDLFPPFYTYTLDKSTTSQEEEGKDSPSLKPHDDEEEYIKRIQEMYDRVRIDLNQIEKERQQKCIQVGEPLSEHLPQKSPIVSPDKSKLGRKTPTNKEECIWTAEELAFLRQATEETKQEKTRLQAELSLAIKQREKLGRKCKRQSEALAVKNTELLEKTKETERLSLRCHHLEKELKHCRMITRLQEEDIDELKESKQELKKQFTALRHELSVEKLTGVKLKGELQQVGKKNALETIVREDGIRLDYERQIKSLYEELQGAKDELDKEKRENTSTRKALEHLRIHFANFPAVKDQSEPLGRENDELGQLNLY